MKKTVMTFVALAISVSIFSSVFANNNSYLKSSDKSDFDKFGIGFGIGIGGFYPEHVNQWLENRYSYASSTYNLGLYLNESLSFVMTFRPARMLRINAAVEAAIGPKLVAVGSGTNFHNFGRYSVGAEVLFNIPVASGRNSIVLGAGPWYHSMYFEDFTAKTVGLRVIPFGMSFQFGGFQPQILLGADFFSKGIDSSNSYEEYDPYGYPTYYGTQDFELDYNGGFIKILLLF